MERRGSAWVGGFFLIGLGIMLLMQNAGAINFGKWWSLLILVPAIGAYANAWKEYCASGYHLTGRAGGALIAGVALTGVTAALLFELDWGWFGPSLLLLAGTGFIFRSFVDQKSG